jgi:hypothetical protein
VACWYTERDPEVADTFIGGLDRAVASRKRRDALIQRPRRGMRGRGVDEAARARAGPAARQLTV